MGFFNSMDVSASGLTAQRLRLDIISNNIANVNTTRTEGGGPFQRERVILQEHMNKKNFSDYLEDKTFGGVKAVAIEKDPTPFKVSYDPTHPDADPAGYVMMPNVNIVTEMVDMVSAARSY
ncbi:MAG: flagellar basal body rod protein FlgC, partial [Tepidanaerobacteraceae bacterium]|nr:flagellar basal body rod protein FlgC [Tepidanaerobacteraceae bacterium]